MIILNTNINHHDMSFSYYYILLIDIEYNSKIINDLKNQENSK